jgi:S-adenosylmethionine:tRNA ribosyltransferase-isomerase
MRVDEFDYALPPDLIAQTPIEPRDSSRLLVVDRAHGTFTHRRFFDLPELLRPGDTMVLNDSRVLPARLHGTRDGTGGAAEVLLLRHLGERRWLCLARPAKRIRNGRVLTFGSGALRAEVQDELDDGQRVLEFDVEPVEFESVLARLGEMPLPPYIHSPLNDPERYQTVYARVPGSAAAPTAGLHFTPGLLDRVEQIGARVAYVTLHVGLGTFRPVQVDEVANHHMHAEYGVLPLDTAAAMAEARASGGRVIAVGTTALRVLEAAAFLAGKDAPWSGWTDIFIYPGFEFRAVDALVTNFHLPRSTLLMLVSALAGKSLVDRAYATAIAERYRFFSFGDAMLIV